MPKKPHIIIVGGGVIGSSIAYHLARQNAGVTLVESGDLASGSSGACDGLVFMQSKKPGIHLELALESLKRFQTLQRELPVDIEFRQSGGLVVIETGAELAAMETFVREQRAIGLDVRLLDRDETLATEPALSDRIAGATYSPLDGQVNPIRLCLGFGLAARQNGARILTRTRVSALMTAGGRVTGVETDKGTISGDIVVNATGAMAGLLEGPDRTGQVIRPRRGQIVVTRAAAPLLSHCLISAKYIAAKFDPSLAASSGEGISMEQTDSGTLLLGSTREFAGFDRRTTLSGIRKILCQTATVLPQLARLSVIRTFAGLRPYTPDGMPLLGPVSRLDNLFMAAGHEGDGIALAPITGELMADYIMGKRPRIPLDAFSPDRFGKTAAGRKPEPAPQPARSTANRRSHV